jgi:pyrrolidone-carboxylate peptidase
MVTQRFVCSVFWLTGAGLSVAGCGTRESVSYLNSDLGGDGNRRVAAMYFDYTQARESGRRSGCGSSGVAARRVLIQGFGPFQNARTNISGLVVESLSLPSFWPATTSLEMVDKTPADSAAWGRPTSLGAFAAQRTLTYNGITYEVCFVVTSVQWDFAAAVVTYEAQKFRPNLVLMTGRGNLASTARLESAALNRTVAQVGFDDVGAEFPGDEVPRSEPVLVGEGVRETVALSWHPQQVAAGLAPALNALKGLTQRSYDARVVAGADPKNTYICNNIAFVLSHAALNVSLRLAGGALVLTPRFAKPFRTGFFHFPLNSGVSSEAVYGWGHVLMNLVERELGV